MTDPTATYTFLPWLRQGIASKIKQVDTLNEAVGTHFGWQTRRQNSARST